MRSEVRFRPSAKVGIFFDAQCFELFRLSFKQIQKKNAGEMLETRKAQRKRQREDLKKKKAENYRKKRDERLAERERKKRGESRDERERKKRGESRDERDRKRRRKTEQQGPAHADTNPKQSRSLQDSMIAFKPEDLSFESVAQRQRTADDDEALIEYLEKQLGVKGDAEKMSKLHQDITQEEFGGDDILGLAETILSDETQTVKNIEYRSPDESSETHMAETVADVANGRPDDSSESTTSESGANEETASDRGNGENKMAESGSPESQDNGTLGTNARDKGRATAGMRSSIRRSREAIDIEPKKYIPPHLRHNAQDGDKDGGDNGDETRKLTAKLKSLLNRVSEGNLNVLLEEILKAIKQEKESIELSSLGEGNSNKESEVTLFLLSTAREMAKCSFAFLEAKASAALIAPQMALLCGLSGLISAQILAEFARLALAEFRKIFDSLLSKPTDESISTAGHFDSCLDGVDTCRHIITALAFLAYFGCLGPDLFVALASFLADSTGDQSPTHLVRRLDFLISILRIYGPELKKDFPQHFKNLNSQIEVLYSHLDGHHSVQVDFLKHELAHLGRTRRAPMFEKFLAMKNWLSAKNGHFRTVDWAQVQLEPQLISAESFLTSLMEGKIPETEIRASDGSLLNDIHLKSGESVDPLFAVANKLKIKTPLQQQAFVAIIGANDVADAVDRILKVIRRKSDVLNVVAVVLHCHVQEKYYNEFYEKLLLALCNSSDEQILHRFRRGLRQGLHAMAGSISKSDKETLRKKAILVKLADSMIRAGILPCNKSLFQRLNFTDGD
eukprot:Gregarina_sp_Poly_1__8520@NODE_502_length_7877_cov_467_844558_g402_i0_p1_GENE_NODE_502_length_7877_cov_467_844558_g402_i0NODE_502_length_7877_cov_467_844558_g402_i0_p1_ORF_typecomplete_len794_score160_86MA3/PF02847_17/3_7e10MIF4G/PF02854_19/0_028MIF4G/PF02854_19/3_2e02DUF4494/PF14902_6/0_15_NODE_502_length_7877_cov_467_844558_g402_i016684049